MTDIKDKDDLHFDDDFQFDEVEHHEPLYGTKPQSSVGVSGLGGIGGDNLSQGKNPRKIIIVGIVCALIVILAIYYIINRSSNPLGDAKKPSVATSAQDTNQVATDAAPGTAVAPTPTPPQPSKIEVLTNQVNQLEQTINQQQETITALQGNISTLQDTVNSLNSSVSGMTGQLATAINRLPKAVVKKAKPQETLPPPVTYIVKAMVPGRAWLQGSDGSTLSVAVGNEVPGHGAVADINLNAGQVSTSDGTVFNYNIDGN